MLTPPGSEPSVSRVSGPPGGPAVFPVLAGVGGGSGAVNLYFVSPPHAMPSPPLASVSPPLEETLHKMGMPIEEDGATPS